MRYNQGAKNKSMNYQILLFYKYTYIEDPEAEMENQKAIFQELGLKGRMILAHEGINGTLEGKVEDTETYIDIMKRDPRFADIHWKKGEGTGNAFPKVSIKVRSEIVSMQLGENDFSPTETTGKYITADELHKLYESGEEFYVVDMRNDYEQEIGHFENAILMPMKNFRELPEVLNEIAHLKHKKVVTTCTGGVRCEKASGFLIKHGFTDVYQLYGGMQTYMEQHPNKHFIGKLYVFDNRVVWGVNTDSPEHKVISHCALCGKFSDNYVDCSYLACKNIRHFIACADCHDENGHAFCSEDCKAKAYVENKIFVRV